MLQNIYGYGRVSSKSQNEARQVSAFKKLGIKRSNIIIEKISGKTFNRREYNRLLKILSEGDILYISSIDRLGRDYDGILDEWNRLTKEMKVYLKVLDMPILDTDNTQNKLIDKFLRDIILITLAYQAEQEWHNIRERQKMGIEVAKESGKHLGRPKANYTQKEIEVISEWNNGLISLNEAMKKINKKKSSFYRMVQDLKN